MSTKEANENDKKTMEYTLNVISKLNRAMHDIYVVQKMQKKRINLTKILRDKLISAISAEVYMKHLLKVNTGNSLTITTSKSSARSILNTDTETESEETIESDLSKSSSAKSMAKLSRKSLSSPKKTH